MRQEARIELRMMRSASAPYMEQDDRRRVVDGLQDVILTDEEKAAIARRGREELKAMSGLRGVRSRE